MPAVDGPLAVPVQENNEQNSNTSLPVIGIIYPPPEVRNIVDKTASFVARNGPEFESRIRQNELNNPKFNFLNIGDPYHAYYQHKVKEFREGHESLPAPVPGKQLATTTQQKQQELLKQMEQLFIPKDPPPEFEFTADPPSISALDLDIVKLTAQFVARNGRQFLTNLMNREQRNYQFDFLRPQHSLFLYFTKLLEQYTKVLIPPKDLMNKLKEEASNPVKVLEKVKYRADWIKHQEAQRRREEQALEKERVAYAQIDWHDFVVVETVDYMQGEAGNFPPPTTPDDVGARVLMQERMMEMGGEERLRRVEEDRQPSMTAMMMSRMMESDSDEEPEPHLRQQAGGRVGVGMVPRVVPNPPADKGVDNTQVQDMEEGSSEEEEDEGGRPEDGQPPPPGMAKAELRKPLDPPIPDRVIVKKGYNPKQSSKANKGNDDFLISPLTGEKVVAEKIHEHMRIGLLDPRWVEQRDKHIQDRINQENVYAPGSAIEASLKQLAERRTDIFGVGDEETAIGKKIGEEEKKKDDKVTWDGHTSSVEAATRAARANITIEDQIHQIHKVKGLLPDEEKEKIGPKAAGGGQLLPLGTVVQAAPVPAAKVPAPPLPPPGPPAPPPPPSALLPPAPPPGPPIMMVPAPLMVRGGFPTVVPAPGAAFMTGPPPGAPQAPTPIGLLKPQHGLPTDPDDEPATKKQKTEDQLIPEAQFLQQYKSPVTFSVIVPLLTDKPEWRLNGQAIPIAMNLEESIATLKAQLHEATGMPPGKQKLQFEGMFFKDSNSLAYYNITPGSQIFLQLKERGGRRK